MEQTNPIGQSIVEKPQDKGSHEGEYPQLFNEGNFEDKILLRKGEL